EARAENVIRRHDSFERGLDDLLWRSGDNVEMELVALCEIVQGARKERHVMLQADALAGLDKVLAPDLAEVRVMENQIAEFRALLDEVHLGKAFHLVMKSVEADQLAKNDSRVVEAKRLVKVTGQ